MAGNDEKLRQTKNESSKNAPPLISYKKDQEGRVLSEKYRLIRLLAEGGMGSVYEAEHVLIRRRVAVKVMHALFSASTESVKRFLGEARAAGTIGHPNIIEIFDVGEEEDGTIYIVMELLKGESLQDLLDRDGSLPAGRAVAVVLQMLSALFSAHKKGILHRDLKPDNIFLAVDKRNRQEVKLLDFGVAKFQNPRDESLGLTKTGAVLGTPYYLAPEQAKGGKFIDSRIDIWSAGAVMYETLAGRVPFDGDNYNEIIGKILLEDPVPLSKLTPNLPSGLAEIVEKSLAREPEDRYQNVGEMIEALLPFHDQSDELMNTSVIQVLHSSVAPELYSLKPGKPLEILPRDSTTPNESIIDDMPTADYGETNSSRLAMLLASKRALFAVAVVITLVIAGLFVISANGNRDENEKIGDPDPVRDKASTTSKKGETAKKDTPSNQPEQSAIATAAPSPMTTIELDGLPPEAKVYLDQKQVAPPIETPRSTHQVQLRVAAPGYQDYEKTIVPDKDILMDIRMSKAAPTRKEFNTTRKRVKLIKKARKKDDDWAKNPFAK